MEALFLPHSSGTYQYAVDKKQTPLEKHGRRWQQCQQVMEQDRLGWVR